VSDPNLDGIPPQVLTPLADLFDCLCTEVNLVHPVCSCALLPGQAVAWDYCGECGDKCGQAWLRLMRVYPYDVWPDPATGGKCTSPLAMEVEIGVVRCIPALGEGGELPDIADIELSTMLQIADMWAMYRAIVCCKSSFKSPQTYEAVGPLGGCVGGTWRAILAVE